MNIERLGWVAAAAMAGGIIGMGFRAPSDKTGTVDIAKVFNESELAKTQTEKLRGQIIARRSVMEYVSNNRYIKTDDANKLHDLLIKDVQTPADKADVERIKADAAASETKVRELQTKEKPSAAELAQLDDYQKRKDQTGNLLEKWKSDFENEIQTKKNKADDDTMQEVKKAIAQVGHDQGYSIILSQQIAPYCPNDITTEAGNKMNSKK